MKALLILSFIFMTNSYACTYFSESKEVLYQGFTVNYESALDKLLDRMGLTKATSREEADINVEVITGDFKKKRFHYTYATLNFYKYEMVLRSETRNKICLGMLCSAYDMRKAIAKLFKKVDKKKLQLNKKCEF